MSEPSLYLRKIITRKSSNTLDDYKMAMEKIGLSVEGTKTELCKRINDWIEKKSKKNKLLKEYFTKGSNKENCELLINTIKELVDPSMPIKAPIPITEAKYNELIEKRKNGSISSKNMELLEKCLHIKYCYCVKRRILLNELEILIHNKPLEYNAWQTCGYSIYKSRGFPITENASMTCKTDYSWYN
jgi:hypothetical protein